MLKVTINMSFDFKILTLSGKKHTSFSIVVTLDFASKI